MTPEERLAAIRGAADDGQPFRELHTATSTATLTSTPNGYRLDCTGPIDAALVAAFLRGAGVLDGS